LAVFTVTNTFHGDAGSLAAAIADAAIVANVGGVPDEIHFNIPATDPGHVYYRDDGIAGQVAKANITPTTAASDADILDRDPDWPHSWYSIRPTSAHPAFLTPFKELVNTDAMIIDGYTQPGAMTNTNSVESRLGLNTIPRIEIDGSALGEVFGFRFLPRGHVIRGLVINGFGYAGISVLFSFGPPQAAIEGNFIGTDISGTQARPNGRSPASGMPGIITGIEADNITIGGTTPEARNLISGNAWGGIAIDSANNRIQGNLIGSDRTGTQALGNGGTNIGIGISLASSSTTLVTNNLIGGTAPGAGNLISGNEAFGIRILNAPHNAVQGNFIGTDITGTGPLPNGNSGVRIVNSGNAVGGIETGAGNRIAYNYGRGVQIDGGTGNAILGNSIFANDNPTDSDTFLYEVGIDLNSEVAGVTPNDPGDTDGGPNGLQNFPVLSSVETSGSQTTIHGTLDSTPGATFTLQFFANEEADPSGHGEGQFLLGTAEVTPDSAGNFTVVLPVGVSANQFVTATATDAGNNTSEFSLAVSVVAAEPENLAPTATIDAPATAVRGQPVSFQFSANDPDAADQAADFEYAIDWNSDGSVDESLMGPASGVTRTRVFTTTGNFQITATATDQTGNTSEPAVHAIQVSVTALIGGDLFVGGTSGSDSIQFVPASSGRIWVVLNGALLGPFAASGRIVAYGQAGDDTISALNLTGNLDVQLHGDAGNDRLYSSPHTDSLLLGGAGDDYLFGGVYGRSIQIGGAGRDMLVGSQLGNNLLIGGGTTYDENDAALTAILAEWTSSRSFAERVANLAAGVGPGNAFKLVKNETILDDAAVDQLFGGTNQDWFLAFASDVIYGRQSHDRV
jgi:hypothetical protein